MLCCKHYKDNTHWCNLVLHTQLDWEGPLLQLPQLSWNRMTFTVRHDKLFSSAGLLHHQFKSHRRICAAMDGPYQSPAFFPELLPSSTSRCMPKGAVGLSANQRKILLCVLSTGLSRMDPQLKCRLLLLSLSLELNPSFTECIRSMSSLTTRWFPDQVQPFLKKKDSRYWRVCIFVSLRSKMQFSHCSHLWQNDFLSDEFFS